MSIEVFYKKTLTEVAKALDVEPIFVARHFGQGKGLPSDMRFSNDDIEKIKTEMALSTWWADENFHIEDENHSRRLVRELAYRILKADFSKVERLDNLVRGLQGADKQLLKKALNKLIEDYKVFKSEPMPAGIGIRFIDDKKTVLKQIATGKSIPAKIERLWT